MKYFIPQSVIALFCFMFIAGCSSVERSSASSQTPEQKLLMAIWQENISYIQQALSEGVDVNKNLRQQTPPEGFDSSAEKSKMLNQEIDKMTFLDFAIIKGNPEIVKLLVSKGADVNKNYSGISPLVQSVLYNNYAICEFLISKGADVNYTVIIDNRNYGTPLTLASEEGYLKIARLLVSKKADVNAKVSGDQTALMLASLKGQTDIVKLLLGVKGLKLNEVNDKGATALIMAADMNHTEIIKLLAEKGVDVNKKMNNGFSALVFSFVRKNVEAVEILCKKGASDFSNTELTLGNMQGSMMAIAGAMGSFGGDKDYQRISEIFNKYYKKCTSGNCINGKGTMVFINGTKYTGQFKKGEFNGKGTYTYSDKAVYSGDWSAGKKNGKGTLTMSDGRKFVGEYKDGKQGKGKCFDKKNKPISCDGIE